MIFLPYAVLCAIFALMIVDLECVKLDLWTALYCFRNFIFHVMEFLHNEKRFVSLIVKASRDHYDHLLFPNNTATLSSKYVHASSARTVHGLVEEVNNVFLWTIFKYPHFCCMLVKVRYELASLIPHS